MSKSKIFKFVFFAFVFSALASVVLIKYYEFIFSKRIEGKITKIERVNASNSVITTGKDVPAQQLFSFAIAIQSKDGRMHTSSSEDRQWAVVNEGQCVTARLYPYVPWDLEASGTYHNARLLELQAKCLDGN